ncbi:hypothetical protein MACK_000496 [Theileria orientalis]|uniref:C3H1-type domain-containing protein n=1 Tax=Theileria orientalis TaxID=68886 RepID=A0A976QS49_THEOR|nr:hypothetical protein MACK_000496 [Theileria orientalis]
MSSNLTESTRLAQSLTSSSTGTRRDWPAEAVNPVVGSSGLTGVSAGLSANSAGGANTIALGAENFATDRSAAVFQSSLGNYSSANSASSGSGLLGRTNGPIGPSSGMSYKAVTLSKPNPESRKNSVYKLGDPQEEIPLATAGQASLAMSNSGLGTKAGMTTEKARAPSSSSSTCGRVVPTSTNHNVKRGQTDESSDRYATGKGSAHGNSASNPGKGSSKGTSAPLDGTGKHAVLSEEQLATFRTSFCAKHHQNKCPNSDSCEKSHCLTWQRRNPYEISYCPHLCPEIQFVKKSRKMVLYRRCTRGKNCNFAHSKEEELYHPLVYKTKQCSSFPKCTRYFCPFVHDPSEMRDASKFMFEGYPATKGKGSASGAESGKEEAKGSKKGGNAKGSTGLVADGDGETERVEGVASDSNKETYRESRQYLLHGGDYDEYGAAYAAYGEDYALHDYANYDNEYGDEYNSQFAKDYPVYNKEYQDQFTSSYETGEYGVGEQVGQLEKEDQMTHFENLDALDATYGLDRVDRLDSTNYYEDGLGVEGMWSGVEGYSSVGGQQLTGAEYQQGQQGYQRPYQSDHVPGEYQSYQHSGYQQAYQHNYRRASYKDAYQRQYNQQYHDYQADASLSYGQDGRYNQGYQTYRQDYVDKEYYANYPDLPTSNPNASSSNSGSGLTAPGAGTSSMGAATGEGAANAGGSSSAQRVGGKPGGKNLTSSNMAANSGEMSTTYSNYNSADNYHSPGESYQSSDHAASAYNSAYPGNYHTNYSSDYLEASSSNNNYLQNYYQDQDLSGLQYELEEQFSDLGLGRTLDMNTSVDLNSGMDRSLELSGGLDLNGSMDGGMELNDMFVKIINEIEK